jgi:hypothetical protein
LPQSGVATKKVDIEVMKADIVVELFQTMVIVNLNMGKFDSRSKYFEE